MWFISSPITFHKIEQAGDKAGVDARSTNSNFPLTNSATSTKFDHVAYVDRPLICQHISDNCRWTVSFLHQVAYSEWYLCEVNFPRPTLSPRQKYWPRTDGCIWHVEMILPKCQHYIWERQELQALHWTRVLFVLTFRGVDPGGGRS